MGEDVQNAKLYAINKETGEEIELGTILETAELETAETGNSYSEIENINEFEADLEVVIKTISKKRFIKLLMGKRIQKREAIKIHNIFMKRYKHRTEIGLELFINYLLC